MNETQGKRKIMGRPAKEIDKKTFENLCAIQCTKAECCAVLDVTDKVLEKWCKKIYGASFSEVFATKRNVGKVSLRRNQFRLAEKNVSMSIFLGKQYLGQKDYVETEFNSEALKKAVELLSDVPSAID